MINVNYIRLNKERIDNIIEKLRSLQSQVS